MKPIHLHTEKKRMRRQLGIGSLSLFALVANIALVSPVLAQASAPETRRE